MVMDMSTNWGWQVLIKNNVSAGGDLRGLLKEISVSTLHKSLKYWLIIFRTKSHFLLEWAAKLDQSPLMAPSEDLWKPWLIYTPRTPKPTVGTSEKSGEGWAVSVRGLLRWWEWWAERQKRRGGGVREKRVEKRKERRERGRKSGTQEGG